MTNISTDIFATYFINWGLNPVRVSATFSVANADYNAIASPYDVNFYFGVSQDTSNPSHLIFTDVASGIAYAAAAAYSQILTDLNNFGISGKTFVQGNLLPFANPLNDGIVDAKTNPKIYFGTALKLASMMYTASATVSSGVAVFELTDNGSSGGNPLFPNGPNTDSLNCFVSDAAASYQMVGAWSNSNKTLTVTANKLTTSNILTGILGQAAANGAVVRVTVWGS